MVEISDALQTLRHAKGHRRIQTLNAKVDDARLKMLEDPTTKLSDLPKLLEIMQKGEAEKVTIAENIRETSDN